MQLWRLAPTILMMAACGGSTTEDRDVGVDSSSTTSSTPALESPVRTADSGSCASAKIVRGGTGSAPWVCRSISSDGRVITIQVGRGACSSIAGVDVLEGPAKVEVSVQVGNSSTGTCTAQLIVETKEIKLDDRLGARELAGECNPDGPVCRVLRG